MTPPFATRFDWAIHDHDGPSPTNLTVLGRCPLPCYYILPLLHEQGALHRTGSHQHVPERDQVYAQAKRPDGETVTS
jgi:hypothetical protein